MDKHKRIAVLILISIVGFSYVPGLNGNCTDDSCSGQGTCTNVTDSKHNCTCNSGYIGEECQGRFKLSAEVKTIIPEVNTNVTLSVNLEKSDNIMDVNVTVNTPEGSERPTVNDSTFYNYTVSDVQFENRGSYTFVATTNFNGAEHNTQEIVEIPYVLTVMLGATELEKYFEVGNKNAVLSVYVNSSGNFSNIIVSVELPNGTIVEFPSKENDTSRTYSYNIRNEGITINDTGNYTFSATETFDGVSRTRSVVVMVTVEVPPTKPTVKVGEDKVTTDQTVERGTATTFCCTSEGNPFPTIAWSVNSVAVATMGDIYQSGGNLTFSRSAPFSGKGAYICTATATLMSSGSKTEITRLEITINGAPESTPPTMPMQMESVTFSCTFDGFPLPEITWIWKENEGFPSSEIFNITNSNSTEYTITSTVTISHSALCLGNQNITCNASNELSSSVLNTILLNPDPYSIYKNIYFTFPSTEKNYDDARQNCVDLGGNLTQPRTVELRNNLDAISSNLGVNDFFIGLRYDGSKWMWVDGNVETDPSWVKTTSTTTSPSCVVLSRNEYETANCSESKRFSCEIFASRAPTDPSSSTEKCDGSSANIMWTADGFFMQRLKLNETVREENLNKTDRSFPLNELEKGRFYTANISTGYGVCEIHPFAVTSFTTANAQAERPNSLPANYSSGQCQISWNYPRSTEELDGYNISYTEHPRNELSAVESQHSSNLMPQNTSWSFPTSANSQYNITIIAVSCIGDSEQVNLICRSPPEVTAVPDPPEPLVTDVDTSQGISIEITEISDRNGPIECIYVVVRYRNSDNSNPFEAVTFSITGIKTSDQEVSDDEDYFAFALSNANQTLRLGTGGEETTCGSNSGKRKRREVDSLQGLSARNRPLAGNKNYQYYFVAATNGDNGYLFSVSGWSSIIVVRPVPVPEQTNVAAIVVPILVVLIIVILLVLAALWWKKKRSRKDSQVPPSSQNSHVNQAFSEAVIYENARIDRSIAVENLASTYHAKHSDEDRIFREEYRALAMEVSELPVHFNYAMALEVRDKNRFSNIHPANESRVVLRRQGTDIYSDYINASYLDGYRQPRKFIAAQGPLTNTLGDFWYMVWEQESTVIVMLTNVEESGRKKCEKYWPDDGEMSTFENLIVKGVSTVIYGSIVKRTFQVLNPNQSEKILVVEQFHFIAWPDHGVPTTTSALFNLRKMVLDCQSNNPSPIVVHCSAGVGRTGTFIALDVLSNQMERERKVDIYGVVMQMRRKRKEMVQTVEQYSLLHKLMLEKYMFGVTDLSNSEFQRMNSSSSNARYQEIDGTSQQFRNLSLVKPIKTEIHFPLNEKHKVRDTEVVPYQHCRVIIRLRPSEEEVRYINASFVQTYNASDAFIACQSPTEESLEDFWRVILDNNVTVVVMLSKLKEGSKEQCAQYWPEDSQNPCTFGDVIVSLQSETKENGYIERRMQVSEKVLHLRRSLNVMQLHFQQWPEFGVPPNTSDLLELISRTQASRQTSHGKTFPVLVHCSDGAGRTGTFCAIVNLIERLKNEDKVDVFRTVKDLRDMRPLMVRTEEQYKFCSQAVKEYLSSFDLYANFK